MPSPHFPPHLYRTDGCQRPSPHLHRHCRHRSFTLPRLPDRVVRNGRGQNAKLFAARRHSAAPSLIPTRVSPAGDCAVPPTVKKRGFLGDARVREFAPAGQTARPRVPPKRAFGSFSHEGKGTRPGGRNPRPPVPAAGRGGKEGYRLCIQVLKKQRALPGAILEV